MKASLVNRVYLACPNCGGGEHRIDHLFDGQTRSFGPWYCDDCGRGFHGKISSETDIDLEFCEEQKVQTFDLLKLPPQTSDVYFVVSGMRIRKQGADMASEDSMTRYYYEEHTCPTNYIGCECIISDGDDDPHGLFEFVSGVEQVDEMGDDPDFRKIFPETAAG